MSLCMTPSSSIQVLANGKTSFPLVAEHCSVVDGYHLFCIHSSIDGHLAPFHTSPTADSAAMHTGVRVPLGNSRPVSFG